MIININKQIRAFDHFAAPHLYKDKMATSMKPKQSLKKKQSPFEDLTFYGRKKRRKKCYWENSLGTCESETKRAANIKTTDQVSDSRFVFV